MRPVTLAETIKRIIDGESREKAIAEFLDAFYLTPSPEGRLATLRDEPPLVGEARLDSLAGAIAEYLARQYDLPRLPDWMFESVRYLNQPWHTSMSDDDGMREYLTFVSPAEFRSRNIFTEERPLRRARTKLTPVARDAH